MSLAPGQFAGLLNKEILQEPRLQIVLHQSNLLLQKRPVGLGTNIESLVVSLVQKAVLAVEARVTNKQTQNFGAVAQLLLQSLENRVVDQCAHLDVLAPCLELELHFEFENLVNAHEVVRFNQVEVNVLVEHVEQRQQGIIVDNLEVESCVVLPKNAQALPGIEGVRSIDFFPRCIDSLILLLLNFI